MEVVETPTFWCPHVERAACTNFSPRTVELRPPKSRKIFPFPFSSFSFSLPFFLRTVFFFSFSLFSFSHFLLFFRFFFSFLFLISSHFPFIFSPFSLPFGWAFPYGSREGNSLLPSSIQMNGYLNSILIPYFFIPLYDIIHYMAQYEP